MYKRQAFERPKPGMAGTITHERVNLDDAGGILSPEELEELQMGSELVLSLIHI